MQVLEEAHETQAQENEWRQRQETSVAAATAQQQVLEEATPIKP
jgi:hypothetical protein